MRLRISLLHLKINGLIIALLLLSNIFAAIMAYNLTVGLFEQSILEKAKSDLALGEALIDSWIPGNWHVVAGQLYKGDTLINNNFAIIDRVAEMTGGTATIFQGDTRVSTNVIREGKRAIGTQVAPNVAEEVLDKGNLYIGTANVVGVNYQTAYKPLRDEAGRVIGMWYIGISKELLDTASRNFVTQMALFTLIGIILSSLIAWVLAQRMINPLLALKDRMQEANSGDLTVSVDARGKDEIFAVIDSFNTMLANIAGVIRKIISSVEQVAQTSQDFSAKASQVTATNQQIADSIEAVAAGSDQQAHAITEAASITTTVSAEIKTVNTHVQEATKIGQEAAATASMGNDTNTQAIAQMNQIGRSMQAFSQSVKGLGTRSQEIGKIVDLITGIAEQTNLLALNAAIEAARAGEQGRGFAVVAEEVRKLAEQSGAAAHQIANLIREIQKDTDTTVSQAVKQAEEVDQGIAIVNEAGTAFASLAQFIRELQDKLAYIAEATENTVVRTNQTMDAMQEISAVAEENTASSEEVNSATEEQLATVEEMAQAAKDLATMAVELEAAVRQFKTD